MQITYIAHSGFLVELESNYCLFDYYEGALPKMNIEKPIIVFCSHWHQDHFNPRVFDMLKQQEMQVALAVLSFDIKQKKWPTDCEILSARFHESYELPFGIHLDTLHSTDEGVAFVLNTPEGNIYHAGDLNDWYWEGETKAYNNNMTAAYRSEISRIEGMTFEAAFVPLDPRLEQNYDRGMCYFLEHTHAKVVYPMHFWKDTDVIRRFVETYPQYKEIVQIPEVKSRGLESGQKDSN